MFGPVPQAVRRRVVVTGLGLVTPLGCSVESSWKRLLDGECGIVSLADDERFAKLPSKVAGRVIRGTGPGEYDSTPDIPRSAIGTVAEFTKFALTASGEALKDSGWNPEDPKDLERTGVAIGSGIGSIQEILESADTARNKGMRRVSPYFIPRILINLAAGQVSLKYGFKGPNHAVSTACATGNHSIGDAFRMVSGGDADVMVAGSTEASVDPLSLIGFSRARSLATKYNDSPKESSRPFDSGRDGFVMGEGAGIMVLEELDHARARNAKIYAEVRGYGMSGDAHHITSPSPDGDGAARAMGAALLNAGLRPEDIGYINAHATSTPIGDDIENRAIKSVFGDHAYDLSISSTKGAIGHLLGAAGSVEAIFSVLALHHGVLPPTLNLTDIDRNVFDLDYVPLGAKRRNVAAVINNSFGFGGTNTSVVFTKLE